MTSPTRTELCEKIIAISGGAENIARVWNCATRLRLSFVDPDAVSIENFKTLAKETEAGEIPIAGIIERPGEIHLVVGFKARSLRVELGASLAGARSEDLIP